jgi:hypothetical protein
LEAVTGISTLMHQLKKHSGLDLNAVDFISNTAQKTSTAA